jgi:hypothetical protein
MDHGSGIWLLELSEFTPSACDRGRGSECSPSLSTSNLAESSAEFPVPRRPSRGLGPGRLRDEVRRRLLEGPGARQCGG